MVEHDDPTRHAGPLADDAWTPPAEFDGFALVRPLGRGAMGQVFLARETTLDRPVAIKVVAAADEPDQGVRDRFLNEARAVARVQHPNVAAIFRIGAVLGRPYLAAEFVDGQTLHDLPKPQPWQRALTIGVGAARGLAAAHRAGVLHCDIKPSNVLLGRDGEVKLVDFGIARLVAAARPSSGGAAGAAHETSTIYGTPLYMAPEVLTHGRVAAAADVWGLGLVLRELLTGALPHAWAAGLGLPALTAAIRAGDPPPTSASAPAAPGALCKVVDRCLRVDPALRFRDAAEVTDALTDVQAVYHGFTPPDRGPTTTPDESTLVAASFGRVALPHDALTRRFYAALFELRPDVRPLFPADLDGQRAKLANMLKLAIDNLQRPERLVPILEDLGLRHAAYAVRPRDFEAVGRALLTAVRELDAPGWQDPAVGRAWHQAFARIAGAMQRGLAEASGRAPV